MTPATRHASSPLLTLFLILTSCSGDDPSQPYVEFIGGGFIFNYRLAEADYGFVIKPLRSIPAGTLLEAVFENPAGGEPLRVRQTARDGMLQYTFRSPSVHEVVANRPYRVELRLLDPATGHELARYQRTFSSDVDQAVLQDRPPMIGPGHQANPETRQ